MVPRFLYIGRRRCDTNIKALNYTKGMDADEHIYPDDTTDTRDSGQGPLVSFAD
jgi:hypothetical protein